MMGPTQKHSTSQPWDSRAPDAPLFIPRTPGGALATLMKEKEKEINMLSKKKVKIIERNGKRLEHILC